MNALLRRGDEVVVLAPLYQQLYSIAGAIGCRLVRLPLAWDRGYVPDLDAAAALIGPRTRMIVVNFPHNPTGATLTVPQQQELIRLAARAGAYLVWDAAFGELTYEQQPLPDPGRFYERAITMGTLSKAFGLPGLRLGWCLAPPEALAPFARIRDYLTLHQSPLVELLARRVIENADLVLAPRLRQAARNRQTLARWIDEQGELVSWVKPTAGVCAFPRLERVADVDAFCRRLAAERGLLLVPGSCFGCPRHVRLGFGGESSRVEEGLRRLGAALVEASVVGNRETRRAAGGKRGAPGAETAVAGTRQPWRLENARDLAFRRSRRQRAGRAGVDSAQLGCRPWRPRSGRAAARPWRGRRSDRARPAHAADDRQGGLAPRGGGGAGRRREASGDLGRAA